MEDRSTRPSRQSQGEASQEAIGHWNPVLLGRELGRRPVQVILDGQPVVLFRGLDGSVGALDDRCPHRRMPLSQGRVAGGHLVCPYHGWTFTVAGQGACPGMPELVVRAPALDVLERFGAIWIKRREVERPAPEIGGGRVSLGALRVRFRAPLELVADNLAEMEHTGEGHLLFGYDTHEMSRVEVRTEVAPDRVRVVASGRQRRLPWPMAAAVRLAGVADDDLFIDDATFLFAPVQSISESYWLDSRTGTARRHGFHIHAFLVPVNAETTDVVSFYFLRPGSPRLLAWARPLLRWLFAHELARDRRLTEAVARCPPGLDGLQLSRFDEPLKAIRARLPARDAVPASGPINARRLAAGVRPFAALPPRKVP